MSAATLRLALVGVPNCGKSALFNALTGTRQKTGNYPGVTVERRWGHFVTGDGRQIDVVDLPGTYSLDPASPDQEVTRDVLLGRQAGESSPDAILCVVDATNLRVHLRFALELKQLGYPIIVALNMMDLARHHGIEIDVERLARELGAPVVPTVAVRRSGLEELLRRLPSELFDIAVRPTAAIDAGHKPRSVEDVRALQEEARRIARAALVHEGASFRLTKAIDEVVLHRVAGPIILFGLLFLMFQAVFAWAEVPMDWIDSGVVWLQAATVSALPEGWLASLISDGVLAGVGSVIVFLPQILILFAFVLVLEQSGYMVRAAFLMDRLMAGVGLNGRAFIPLLSSFACAIPGIMAARAIDTPRDRLTTILIAPLMTCSARLPVYTLIIAAFIPNTTVGPGIGLQGLVMFGLYLAGIVSALGVAAVLKLTVTRGLSQPFLMELPKYQIPVLRDVALGLVDRARIFLRRAGTIILISMLVIWVLASFPPPPPDATEAAIRYSFAGTIGRALNVVFAPIGFTWEISIALIPGLAAREVAVAALGTVYALSGSEDAVVDSLVATLQGAWSLPTALAFLAWYVFAPQCLSTLAVAKRETNSWRWPLFMFGYLFALAYIAAGATYWIAKFVT
ncbi:MAG: ferrous iron transporter B [Rhodospirillales bacterium]|nr:ferrous iron transporter B [Rhodospirillales bacterium]